MSKLLAGLLLRLHGWRAVGEKPPVRQCILVAAPHTSNWDFYYLMLFARLFGVRISWLGKLSLFRFPMGLPMRLLGGIPVDRAKPAMRVRQLVRMFAERPDLVLVIPAEGTRSAGGLWKSGFYHIARSAGIPIALAFLDYRRRVGGFGVLLWPTGEVSSDMAVVRAFYAGRSGLRPELFVEPRLAEESGSTEEDGLAGSSEGRQRRRPKLK